MNSLEITDRKKELRDSVNAIIATCKAEVREMSEDEQNTYNAAVEELERLNAELAALKEKLNALEPLTDEGENNNEETKTETKRMEKKNFSLIKAIRSVSNNKALDNLTAAVVEQGAAEMRNAGLNYVGQIQLPSAEQRAVTVTTEGEDTVATEIFDVVTPLKAKNVMLNAGAKFVTGLVGDLQYPVMSSVNTSWEGETSTASASTPTFTSVKLSPKRLTCVVPISKQFIIQDGCGAEAAIREEIVNAINSKLEETILGDGTGTTTTPAGLFSGVTSASTVSGFTELVAKEAELEASNVYGELKYIVSPRAKAALRGMVKGESSTQLVWENGEVDGTPALSTSNVKNKNFVYGDFSQYIIAQWGNIDITVDNVTLAADGQIRLVVNAYFDAKPLRPEAFVKGMLA